MRLCLCQERGAIRGKAIILVGVVALLGSLILIVFAPERKRSPKVGTTPPPVAETERTNLVLEGGRLCLKDSSAPYTGLMLEHYADGAMRSRSAVSNGLLNGLSEGFYTNAQLQVTEHFKDGVSHGLRTKCYPDGARKSEAEIVDGELHGLFQQWHENGSPSERIEFAHGKPEGEALAFFPSGYLKSRVQMTNGQPAEQTFWKDGEMKP